MVVSTLVTFEKCADGTVKSLYNMDLKKTLFNVSNIVLSIALPGLVCRALGYSGHGASSPRGIAKGGRVFCGYVFDQRFAEYDAFLPDGHGVCFGCAPSGVGLMPNVLPPCPRHRDCADLQLELRRMAGALMLLPLLWHVRWKLYLDAQKQQML
jgi:hypothetical protein